MPTGVLVVDGRLYVADAWHHRVLVWEEFPTRYLPGGVVLGTSTTASWGGGAFGSERWRGRRGGSTDQVAEGSSEGKARVRRLPGSATTSRSTSAALLREANTKGRRKTRNRRMAQ
ncbi:MAG: hypothetical protein C4301_07865, partial [Thermus sp.]